MQTDLFNINFKNILINSKNYLQTFSQQFFLKVKYNSSTYLQKKIYI